MLVVRKSAINKLYRIHVKRFLDIILSVIAFIVLLLPLAVVAIIVYLDMGSPVFFSQRRIGRDCQEFRCMKFRTMTEERDEHGVYLPDPERTTKLGSFLRKTSVDELPSLWNIIRGEMSIVGPRPLPVRLLPRFSQEQLRRHEVRPGLTNPATINGRNTQSWEEQFALDTWYVDNVSFWVDIKNIVLTVKVVLAQTGTTAADGGCRGEFIGTASIDELEDSDGNYMKIVQKVKPEEVVQ